MKNIREIALEVASELSEEGFSGTGTDYTLAFYPRFLAAADAERGKVVGEAFNLPGTMGGFTTCAFRSVDVPAGSKLFLSPTVPLGFALVPIDPSEEWIAKVVRVNQPDPDIGCRAWREEVESLEYWHKAMIQASGVTK